MNLTSLLSVDRSTHGDMSTLDRLPSQGDPADLASDGNHTAPIPIGSPTTLLTQDTAAAPPIQGSLATLLAHMISGQPTPPTAEPAHIPTSPQPILGESAAMAATAAVAAKHKPKARRGITHRGPSGKREAIALQRAKKATR
jgi:hypothetical protein